MPWRSSRRGYFLEGPQGAPMAITDRFALSWVRWDQRVQQGQEPTVFLKSAKDEELIELLAGDSGTDRKYERDIVAVEIQNRLAQRNRSLPLGADEVLKAAYIAYEAAAKSQRAIHAAEGILKASGDTALGVAVSGSAIASLDTTKLALEAAQEHAANVQATLAQSRVAEQLAQDAVDSAMQAAAKAQLGAERIAELGHEEEARVAREAAEALRAAAEDVAREVAEAKRT